MVTLDSHYCERNGSIHSSTAAVQFKHWTDSTALACTVSRCEQVGQYQPGSFYLRELPSLLKAIQGLSLLPDLLVIDGYVQLGQQPGLGWHLYQALEQRCPIIGVAKNPFQLESESGLEPAGIAIQRGGSHRPLYVTAIGIDDPTHAANWVKSMHGNFRIPTLLKLADRLARDSVNSPIEDES